MPNNVTQELRDLVIRLDEKVESLTKKVDDLNNNFAHRLEVVETKKLAFQDFMLYKEEVAKECAGIKDGHAKDIEAINIGAKDREDRIRVLEAWRWYIVGISTALSILSSEILKHFGK